MHTARIVGVVQVLLLCIVAAANDANWTYVGSAGSFTKNPEVQMVREDVRIYLHDDFMNVQITFVFKNHGPGTQVTMAFPDDSAALGEGPAISWLRSTVDGHAIAIKRKHVLPVTDEFNYSVVWLKDVVFKAGQTRVVTTNYRARNGYAGSGYIVNGYVLETGSTWRGPIEHCWVTVDWSNCRTISKPRLSGFVPVTGKEVPLAWKAPQTRVRTLHLRDIRPNFNIAIDSIVGFWNFWLNGRPIPQQAGVSEDLGGALRRVGTEVLIPVNNVARFLGGPGAAGESDLWPDWRHPTSHRFGGELSFDGSRTVVLGDKRKVRLARPLRTIGDSIRAVYLKDLVRALGGTYRYDQRDERVYLTLPQ